MRAFLISFVVLSVVLSNFSVSATSGDMNLHETRVTGMVRSWKNFNICLQENSCGSGISITDTARDIASRVVFERFINREYGIMVDFSVYDGFVYYRFIDGLGKMRHRGVDLPVVNDFDLEIDKGVDVKKIIFSRLPFADKFEQMAQVLKSDDGITKVLVKRYSSCNPTVIESIVIPDLSAISVYLDVAEGRDGIVYFTIEDSLCYYHELSYKEGKSKKILIGHIDRIGVDSIREYLEKGIVKILNMETGSFEFKGCDQPTEGILMTSIRKYESDEMEAKRLFDEKVSLALKKKADDLGCTPMSLEVNSIVFKETSDSWDLDVKCTEKMDYECEICHISPVANRRVFYYITFPKGTGPFGVYVNIHGGPQLSESIHDIGGATKHLANKMITVRPMFAGGGYTIRDAMENQGGALEETLLDVLACVIDVIRCNKGKVREDAIFFAGESYGALAVQLIQKKMTPSLIDLCCLRPAGYIAINAPSNILSYLTSPLAESGYVGLILKYVPRNVKDTNGKVADSLHSDGTLSPEGITYVESKSPVNGPKLRSPTLVIGSKLDERVNISHMIEYVEAVKSDHASKFNLLTAVVFKNESHTIRDRRLNCVIQNFIGKTVPDLGFDCVPIDESGGIEFLCMSED